MTFAPSRAALAAAAVALAAAALIACSVSGASAPAPHAVAKTCSKVASPGGSDRSRGSVRRPYRTVRRLVRALHPGQTGCLRRGNYYGNVKIARGGIPLLPITLRSYPGESARMIGRLLISQTASFVTIHDLYLDGRNRRGVPSPSVTGAYNRFNQVNVTNAHTSICFTVGHGIGEPQFGRAFGTVIEHSRIHGCGQLPPTNHLHGIYVANADNTLIRDNWIYDNADRGIQLYPDAQGTTITGNVIDGNGQGIAFGGENGEASDGNLVQGNAITNSSARHNVEAYYPPGNRSGTGNVVRSNCVFGAALASASGGVQEPHAGFDARENQIAPPPYADRGRRDFRLPATSPCGGRLLENTGAIPGPSRRPPGRGEPGTVTLRVSPRRLRGVRRVRVKGSAHGNRLAGRQVAIRLVRGKRHRTLAHARLNARGTFDRRITIRPHGRRVLRLRAVVSHVGRSTNVRLRVRR